MQTNRRKGFTLIELLIVVVIIGILAAIAIPKFANTKEKAYISAMKSDLRNLATAQETWFGDSQFYASQANIQGTPPAIRDANNNVLWQNSTGVVVEALTGDQTGWSARVSRPGTLQQCVMWIGVGTAASADNTPPGGSTPAAEGEPTCGQP
jgi:type II secretion system protein G